MKVQCILGLQKNYQLFLLRISCKEENIGVINKFSDILIRANLWGVYLVTEAVQAIKVPAVVGSTVQFGALIRWAFLHFVCDLKATQMDVQLSLIWKFLLNEFELSHDATEKIGMWKVNLRWSHIQQSACEMLHYSNSTKNLLPQI